MRKILSLIYAGRVNVSVSEMDQFMNAAKCLKLKGFSEDASKVTADAFDKSQTFSLKLKRIDATTPPSTSKNGRQAEQQSSGSKASHSKPSNSNSTESKSTNRLETGKHNADYEKFFPSDDSDECDSDEMSQPNNGIQSESENGATNFFLKNLCCVKYDLFFRFSDIVVD